MMDVYCIMEKGVIIPRRFDHLFVNENLARRIKEVFTYLRECNAPFLVMREGDLWNF